MYITVDIGGTMIRVASFDDLYTPRIIKRAEYRHGSTYTSSLNKLLGMISSVADNRPMKGISVSIGGVVKGGTIIYSGNLSAWHGRRIAEDITSHHRTKVYLLNDAEAAARGEAFYGKAKPDFWTIIWGTGLGGALVTNREGVLGVEDGEPGHTVTLSDENQCSCGKKGCWETHVGGAAITRRYGKPTIKLNRREWHEVCGHMAQGLAKLMETSPTPTVVFGGGVALNHQERLKEVEKSLADRMAKPPRLVTATLGEDSGLFGALSILKIN